MVDINALMRQQPPNEGQAPQGQAQGQAQSPLAALMGAQQAKPQAPTPGQTTAALYHFSEMKAALKPLVADPKLGKENIRPKLLDSMSKLLASRTLSLPQVMEAIKSLPDDPIAQKKFVDGVYQRNDQAQKLILEQHRGAPDMADPEDPYSPDNHAAMMEGLLKQYQRDKNG